MVVVSNKTMGDVIAMLTIFLAPLVARGPITCPTYTTIFRPKNYGAQIAKTQISPYRQNIAIFPANMPYRQKLQYRHIAIYFVQYRHIAIRSP